MDDTDLLQKYARERSESAFTTLVSRYVNLVYSAALRQLGSPDLAQEVTQSVFLVLADKSGSLSKETILAGWLYRTTRHVAARTLRSEQRRRIREMKAAQLETGAESERLWEELVPLLDPAMTCLSEKDRNALLLRYFQNRALKEVGWALGVNEDAAQKRISRALEKLRSYFRKHRVEVSTAALGTALSSHAIQAAPIGLVPSIAALLPISAGVITASSTTTLIHWGKVMAWTKIKTTVLVGSLSLAIGTPVILQWREAARLRRENQSLREANALLGASNGDESARLKEAARQMEQYKKNAEEVYKLRGEVGGLRKESAHLAALRKENEQMRQKLKQGQQNPLNEDTAVQEEEEKQLAIQQMGDMKGWLLAFLIYAQQNQGNTPTNFADASAFFPKEATNRLDLERFEILQHGPVEQIEMPARTAIIREREPQDRHGKSTRLVGFADGHVEIMSRPMPENGIFP